MILLTLILSVLLGCISIEAITDISKDTNRLWYAVFSCGYLGLGYATFLFISQ